MVQKAISIPEPTNEVNALWSTCKALKEAVEVIQGIRGDREYVLLSEALSGANDLQVQIDNIDITGGSGATQLNELSDVNTSTTTNRFALVADGVDFESRLLVEADISDLGSYLADAPSDGVIYGRENAAWVDVGATGGATVVAQYRFDTSVTEADPGNGDFRLDSATPAAVTEIFVSSTTDNGNDFDNMLGFVSSGDQIYIQQDNDATRFFLLDVTANVDNGGWYSIAVTVAASDQLFGNNAKCHMLILFGGTSGGSVPTLITVTDESSDTLCFPSFFTEATGNLAPKTGTNLSFDSSSGDLSATSFGGIAQADLLDKSAGETVTGIWTFDQTIFNMGTFGWEADQPTGAGVDNFVMTYDNGTGLISLEVLPASIANLAEDNTPQLGGSLDLNNFDIVNSADSVVMLIRGNNSGSIETTMVSFDPDGAVTLNHDGNSKLATSVTGITVTGDVAATSVADIAVGDLLDKSVGETITGTWTFDQTVFNMGTYGFEADQVVGAGTDNFVMTYDNGTGLISLEVSAGGGGAKRYYQVSGSGTPQVITGTPITMDLSDEQVTTGTGDFTIAADVVTLVQAGTYRISAAAVTGDTDTAGAARTSTEIRIEADTVLIPGAITQFYHRETEEAGGFVECFYTAGAGEDIRVRLDRIGATTNIQTVPALCRLNIELIS